jgi:hypothetical protein
MTAGRPSAEIDKKTFEGLCGIQCSKNEICQFYNISTRTLERWCKSTYKKNFVAIFSEKRSIGLISHRRAGFELAKTNAAVWIFLSKNILGMKDNPQEDPANTTPTPVTVTIQTEDMSKPVEDDADKNQG